MFPQIIKEIDGSLCKNNPYDDIEDLVEVLRNDIEFNHISFNRYLTLAARMAEGKGKWQNDGDLQISDSKDCFV